MKNRCYNSGLQAGITKQPPPIHWRFVSWGSEMGPANILAVKLCEPTIKKRLRPVDQAGVLEQNRLKDRAKRTKSRMIKQRTANILAVRPGKPALKERFFE